MALRRLSFLFAPLKDSPGLGCPMRLSVSAGAVLLSDEKKKAEPKEDMGCLGHVALELADLDLQKSLVVQATGTSPWCAAFHELVALCLQPDPEDRPSAAALLRHEFVKRSGAVEDVRAEFDRLSAYL